MKEKRYLIDTHCRLWWHIDPDHLSQSIIQLIENGDTKLLFSVVSAWEISIKYTLDKLVLPLHSFNLDATPHDGVNIA